MLATILKSLCLLALGSPACGWVVRTVIVSASRPASSRGEAETMAPAR